MCIVVVCGVCVVMRARMRRRTSTSSILSSKFWRLFYIHKARTAVRVHARARMRVIRCYGGANACARRAMRAQLLQSV